MATSSPSDPPDSTSRNEDEPTPATTSVFGNTSDGAAPPLAFNGGESGTDGDVEQHKNKEENKETTEANTKIKDISDKDEDAKAEESTNDEGKQNAASRVCGITELLTMILQGFTAKELLGVQRVNKLFRDVVAGDTKLQKKVVRGHHGDNRDKKLDWSEEDLNLIHYDRLNGQEMWDEAMAEFWKSASESRKQYRSYDYPVATFAGRMFDSFIIGMHTLEDYFGSPETPPAILKMAQAKPLRSCCLRLRWQDQDLVGELRKQEGYPWPGHRSGCRSLEMSASVYVDPSKPEAWLAILRILKRHCPTKEEWRRFSDREHSHRSVRISVKKQACCPYNRPTGFRGLRHADLRPYFLSDPIYEYHRWCEDKKGDEAQCVCYTGEE